MRLLLDAHIAPAVASGLLRSGLDVRALREWDGGRYIDADDEAILRAAHAATWVFVTYDQRTIRPLLKEWGEAGLDHGGVVFVDAHTIPQHDVGGLVRALQRLAELMGDTAWENREIFLKRAARS
jgi:hypothetical protein